MGEQGSADWREYSKCNVLSPTECDELFFPKPGGKSKQAEIFCSDCPVRGECLEEALAPGTIGFFAGTTEAERAGMRRFKATLKVASIASMMPPEPKKHERPKLRSITPTMPERSLDLVSGPSPVEEVMLRYNVM